MLADHPQAPADIGPERIYSWAEARPLFGNIGRTTAWRMVLDKTLPAPIRVSANRVGWRRSDIIAWQRARARLGLIDG